MYQLPSTYVLKTLNLDLRNHPLSSLSPYDTLA